MHRLIEVGEQPRAWERVAPRRPRLVIVQDQGSVSPAQALDSLEGLADVTFAVCRSELNEALLPVLVELADVVELGDDLTAAAAELRKRAPDGILTFSESRQDVTAELALMLGLPYHTPEEVRLLTDKYLQRQRLREHGVDSVRSRRLTSAGQWPQAVAEVGLPAVVKPSTGQGSRSTYRVDSAEEGAGLVARLLTPVADGGEGESSLVLEEFLQGVDRRPFGDYVSVESGICDGRVFHWAVTGRFPLRPPFREVGLFWPASHLDDSERDAALALATAAIEALGLTTGITHMEMKLTADGPRIIEVNGRLGGLLAGLGARARGLDPILLAARLALGHRIDSAAVPAERTVFGRILPSTTEPSRVLRVHGLGEALELPALETYEPMAPLGRQLPGGVGTGGVAVLWGSAADTAEMFATVEAALDRLAYTLELPDGTRRVSARELDRNPLAAIPSVGQ